MTRPIAERMAEAKAKMLEQRKRTPRVFFLGEPDFAEFEATNPPTIDAMFALPLGHKPRPITCAAFDGLPVRRSTAKPRKDGRYVSHLISRCGVSVLVAAK